MQKMACQTRRPSQNIHSALLCALLLISCCALFSLPAVQSSTSCSSVSSSGAAFADDASSCAQEKCTAPEIICCTCGTSSSTSAASSATSPSSASSASSSPSPASSGSSSASSSAPSSSSSSSSSSAASASSSPAPSSSASGSTTVPSGSSTSSGNSSGSTSESCLSTCYSQCYSSSSYATASPYSSAYASSAAYNSSSSGGTAGTASPAESSSASAYSSSAPAGTSSASSASPASSPAATSTAASSSQSSATSGSTYPPEPCPCQLINALVQFKYQQLNSSEQQVFEDNCLVQLRAILVDVSLSVEQKIAQCGYVLRGFCAAHPDIGDKCKWVEVPGWGYVYDFAFMVAFAYEDELANSVCQLTDNSTGANNLTVEISNGTSAGQCGNSSVWSGFVSDANRINRRDIPTMSRARQLAWYSQVLELIYFQQYPDQEQCVRNISLAAGGYAGTVGEFLGLCDWYNTQSELLNSVLADSTNATSAGDCPYVQSLQAGVSAANQSVNSNSSSSSSSASYNSSTVQEAQSFVDYCYSQFANVSDVSQRLQIVLAKFAQLSIQCRLLLKPIKIVGALVQCICADVIAIGNSCANGFACTNLTYGGPGESLEETCLVDGHNVSTLVEASQSYKNSLDSQHQLSYTSYHNAIRNCCYSSSYGTNLTARAQCAQYYVTNWAGNQASVRAVYNQVQLTTTVVTKVNATSNALSAFFGTFGCFCQCATC